jgi:hypothetical protein
MQRPLVNGENGEKGDLAHNMHELSLKSPRQFRIQLNHSKTRIKQDRISIFMNHKQTQNQSFEQQQ